MNFLLDTNICIYIIKRKPIQVFEKFNANEIGQIGISSITLAELIFGAEKSLFPKENFKAVQLFIEPLMIAEFGSDAALHYGKLRTYLEKSGRPIGSMDMLIAAHALSLKATLVTNNSKEFTRVEGLKIENWVLNND